MMEIIKKNNCIVCLFCLSFLFVFFVCLFLSYIGIPISKYYASRPGSGIIYVNSIGINIRLLP